MIDALFPPGGIVTCDPAAALAWEEWHTGASIADAPEIFFWQSAYPCVVVGLTQDPLRETFPENLAADGVKLFRRASGGGAVMLGTGVLCFAVFASMRGTACVESAQNYVFAEISLRESFAVLTAPVSAGVAELLARPAEIAGISDLVLPPGGKYLQSRKFAGTAQLRKKNTLMVHGAILVANELALLNRYLAFPSESPAYREGRTHTDFCVTLSQAAGRTLTLETVAKAVAARALSAGWQVKAFPDRLATFPEVANLLSQKYAYVPWNWQRARQS